MADSRVTLAHYGRKLLIKEEQYNHAIPFPDYLLPYVMGKKELMVADLGAGPFSTVGTKLDGCKVTLIPSDILAEEFRDMCDHAGIKQYIPVEYQNMTRMRYPDETFDIVHCVNAIDHVLDIRSALHEMNRVCKTNGVIYLRHYQNQGEKKNYCGFHRWNIELSEHDCRIWNEDESFFLDDLLPFCTMQDGRMIVSVMVK